MTTFCAAFLSSPLLKNIAYTFVFHSASDQLHDQFKFPDFRPTCRTSSKQRKSAKQSFGKITQQYILPIEYTNSDNFLLFKAVCQLDDLSKKEYSVILL